MSAMRLSQPVQLPEKYRAIILAFLKDYAEKVTWELRNNFGVELPIEDHPHTDDDLLSLLVADAIADMARAANGDIGNLDRGEVYEGIQSLVEYLFGIPGESRYNIPQEFWQSDFGSMVMLAYLWSAGEELITISDAVSLSGKSASALSQLVKRGKLTSYPDMGEPNPQRRTRVLKSEIEKLK